MRRRGLALCAGLLLLLGLLPGTALALAIVDQKNDVWSDSVQVSGGMAQTFTAGRTGSMTGADVMVYTKGGTTTVTLQIEKLAWMGFPDDTPLVSATRVVGTAENWVHFSFQPLGITAGQSYAIVFHATSVCYAYEVNANLYPNGRAVYNPHGAWADLLGSPNHDLVFRTWMNVPPQLMTLLPTATPTAAPTAAATSAPVSTSSLAPGATPASTLASSDSSMASEASTTEQPSTEPASTDLLATETPVVTATPALESGPGAGGSSSSAAPIAAAVVMVGLAGGLMLVLLRRRRLVARE